MTNTTQNNGPECKKCGTTDPNLDPILCRECMEKAICSECATEIQRELDVCSDYCVIAAISRIQTELRKSRRIINEMSRSLGRIRSISADEKGGYPQALGAAQGEAGVALAWVPTPKQAA